MLAKKTVRRRGPLMKNQGSTTNIVERNPSKYNKEGGFESSGSRCNALQNENEHVQSMQDTNNQTQANEPRGQPTHSKNIQRVQPHPKHHSKTKEAISKSLRKKAQMNVLTVSVASSSKRVHVITPQEKEDKYKKKQEMIRIMSRLQKEMINKVAEGFKVGILVRSQPKLESLKNGYTKWRHVRWSVIQNHQT